MFILSVEQQAPCAAQDNPLCTETAYIAYPQLISRSCASTFTSLLLLTAGMGIPLVVLGCIVIPLLPCLLLLQRCRRLDTADVKRRWGFLYCNYR